MSATSTGVDPQMVKNVVDRLKKQGLFDRFRKECLADVDTKPAYQNLQHRVEGAVGRFLSTQTWSRDMNKNQLRDSLRRHLTESQILSTGVDRVIEQVVNPKIQNNFKPEIDRVICEYMGIDFNAWLDKKRLREEIAEREKRLAAEKERQDSEPGIPQNHMPMNYNPAGGQGPTFPGDMQSYPPNFNSNIPSLLDLPLTSSASAPHLSAASSYNPVQPGFGTVPPTSTHASGQFSNYPMPGGSFFPPTMFPPTNIPPPPLNFSTAPPAIIPPAESAPQTAPTPSADYILELVQKKLESDPAIIMPDVPSKAENANKTEKQKKKVEPLTVESLLNIPLPKSETPKSEKQGSQSEVTAQLDEAVALDTATPQAEVGTREKVEGIIEETVIEDSQQVNLTSDQITLTLDQVNITSMILTESSPEDESWKTQNENSDAADELGSAPKVYQFAWNTEIDNLSDVTVSSVHTSDVSSYYDSNEDDDEFEDDDKTEEDHSPEPENLAEDVKVTENVTEIISTEIKASPIKDGTVLEKPKPRKLISLTYNLSDSDNDETREERKARIAREKEERYLKRQQRRAELEAKKKEREEEKLRARQSRSQSTKQPADTADGEQAEVTEVSSGAVENLPDSTSSSSPVKSPLKSPLGSSSDSPSKLNRSRSRKTKAQLKEELREQKVLEKCRALRRQRTRNRKYYSEEFESIFTEKKGLLVGDYVVAEQQVIVEEAQQVIEEPHHATEGALQGVEMQEVIEESQEVQIEQEVECPPTPPTPTQDENVEIETSIILSGQPVTEPAEQSEVKTSSRAPSPYSELSDISESSKEWDKESNNRSSRQSSHSPDARQFRLRRRGSSSSSRSRSRSSSLHRRERGRRRSYSSSSSYSRGRSSSRSRHFSDSRSRSRSTSRSKSCNRSQSGEASHRASDDAERKKRSIEEVSFGEAARRSAKRWIETVDFGEAARRTSGQETGTWPAQRGQKTFNQSRGGGPARRQMRPGTMPIRGATSPRGRNYPSYSNREAGFAAHGGQYTQEHGRSGTYPNWQKSHPAAGHDQVKIYSPAQQDDDRVSHEAHSSQSRDSCSSSPLSAQRYGKPYRKRSRSLSPGERSDTDEEMRLERDVNSPASASCSDSPPHASAETSLVRGRDWSPSSTEPPSNNPQQNEPRSAGRRLIPRNSSASADKPVTRAGRRRSEQENAPIAKRLRR